MFIGRERELKFLEQQYNNAHAQFVVLYGRRRVGKTELLRQFCQDKDCIFYTCTEIPDEQQLKAFSTRILEKHPAAKYLTAFSNWEQAFDSVTEIAPQKKIVIVIDEFPYMVRNNKAIPSVLQKLWDEKLHQQNIMLIVCGSAMSFMEKEVLSEKNPLYGRATGILKLQELDFYEAVQFFPNYSDEEKVTAYAILGGIPHYLRQFAQQKTLSQNIIDNILMRGSILYSEVEFLLRQELRESSVYNSIIEAVALGNTKLNDIYQKTGIERSKLSSYLTNLIELGIICREFPIATAIKEQANSQRGLYRVTDNFFRFWYSFVFPYISELESGDAEGIYKFVVAPDLERYTSYSFENVCCEFLRRQNRSGKLPFYFTGIGRWWDKANEIDVVAVDKQAQKFLVGECKYKHAAVDVKDLKHLLLKNVFAGAEKYYYFFSRNGYTEAAKAFAEENSIRLYCLNELM